MSMNNSPLRPVYNACGALAGVAMIALLVLIMANILGRLLGFYLRGADAYAGYAMAASSFFALAYALGHGDHIRVTLFLQKLQPGPRRAAELWCYGAASLLSALFAYYSIRMAWWSYTFNDVSQANDATPLWIPQSAMAIGVSVLFLAFVDGFVRVLRGGPLSGEDVTVTEQHTE